MAGEKLSPRQKMIGMMYLVLTALLALQVTSSVLDRFYFLDLSLQRQVDETSLKNNRLLQSISQEVETKGKRKEDLAVLDKAKLVRERTKEIQEFATGLKDELLAATGGTVEGSSKPAGAKDEDATANLMINKKKGQELQKALNDYAAFLREETGEGKEDFPDIAHDGKNHPVFKDDPEQKGKDFANLNFANTPMVAAMATITQFETEVMSYESKALNDLAEEVGAKDLSFDQINVRVIPQSNIVAAGANYEADMFIAASSSSVSPEMFFNGKPLTVEGGFGKVKFKATGGTYDKEGLIKKTYKADVSLNDSTYTSTIEYFVAKPVIQVQSQSVSALYLGCGNELNVQVPALGTNYNPAFAATGGQAIKGPKKGLVTVVPNSANVKLTVRSNGDLIGTEDFKVRRVPLPKMEVRSRGRELNVKKGESISRLRSIEIKAVPDEGFKQFLPKDARYRVTKWEVTLARGSRPVGSPKTISSESASLADFSSRARPGDRLVVEVKQVQRMNFRNKVENVNIGTFTMVIPLTE